MRSHRSLLVLFVAVALLTVGCAGPGDGEEFADAETMTLAPGTTASMPLMLNDTDADPEEVTISTEDDGLDASLSNQASNGETGLAAWLTVSASESAEDGEHVLDVLLDGEERQLPVTVDTPDDPLQEGEIGHLTFTARTSAGEVVMTNDERTAQSPLPKAASYQDPQQFEPISAQLVEQGQLPAPLVNGVIGSEVGHTNSVDVPEIFGPEKIEQTQQREETIQREIVAPSQMEYPTQQAQRILPRDAQEGDEVDVPATQDGQMLPYVIEELGQQQVSFSFAAEEGQRLTLYEAWPDAANVTDVGAEEVTVYVTPEQQEGDTLTWVQEWGNVTEVTSITEEEIVLRHSPEEGLTYQQMDRRSQQAVETEIVQVTEDEIVLSQTNPHPLAGETLTFDVTIVDREEAPDPN